MTNLTFAVLVDGENAPHSQYISVLEEVEKYGSVAIKWVYADWTSNRQVKWQTLLHETASSPKQQFHYGKDACDHALVMDTIELICKNSRVDAVCIVSSDGGFYSLAQRIREHGLHVMAIGNEKTPERFRKACHNFVFSKNLSIKEQSKPHSDLEELLVDSYQRCAETNEPVYLGDFGSMLKTIDSSFDPRTYGSTTLKKLIREQKDLFDIVDEQVDRCFVVMKSKPVATQMLNGTVRKWDEKRGFGFITSDVGDFYFSSTAWKADDKVKLHSKVQFYTSEIPANGNNESRSRPSACNITQL